MREAIERLFPIRGNRFVLEISALFFVQREWTAIAQLVRYDTDGSISNIIEQKVVLVGEPELSRAESVLRERVAAIATLESVSEATPQDWFYHPPAPILTAELMAEVKRIIEEQVEMGYTPPLWIVERAESHVCAQVPEVRPEQLRVIVQWVHEALERHAKRESGWHKLTHNDRLSCAFSDLREKGICAIECAGYTMSDGWSDIAEARETMPRAWGGVFFHEQDVERGIRGEGLNLAFGAFIDSDPEHETESKRLGEIVVETLEAHGVPTEWNGSIQSRIAVLPFEWRKRRVTRPRTGTAAQ